MNTSVKENIQVFATSVWFEEHLLCVSLADGREVRVPLTWFPRLQDATKEEKEKWRFIGQGQGIHWELLDEDLSVKSLLAN